MRSYLAILIGFLMVSANVNAAGLSCMELFESSGSTAIDKALSGASEAYGESKDLIKTSFFINLKKDNIRIEDIEKIVYMGALESLPPQHMFGVTVKNGKTTTVLARAEVSSGRHETHSSKQLNAISEQGLNKIAGGYGLDADLFRAEFFKVLEQSNIRSEDVANVEYVITLESNPVQEVFKISTKDGKSQTITVSLPPKAQRAAIRSSGNVIVRPEVQKVAPIEQPRATTLPLPSASRGDVDKALSKASSAYGENKELILESLYKDLAKANIDLKQIHRIEYEGALEAMPPLHMFGITKTDGSKLTVYAKIGY
jgi:hypothetical protein